MAIYYENYDYTQILDRPDLQYSPYVAALDIQYSHNAPYLWTFTLDSTGIDGADPIAYGRSFAELLEFLHELKRRMKLMRKSEREKHCLIVIVADLFRFFAQTKKALPYSAEPFVAKSASDVLLATILDVYELHSYKAYFETELEEDMLNDYGIITEDIDVAALSERCELTEDEIDNSANKSFYMAYIFRQELDLKYQGAPGRLVLTKTSRVKTMFAYEERKASNKAACNLRAQIMKMNPICSEYGREFLLPLLYKAFIGGAVFYEPGVPNKEFENVSSVDLSSAYASRMVLSRYPIGKFEELPQPKSYKDLFEKPYSRYAMLITFTAEGVEVLPDGLAFIPAQLRAHYIDVNDKAEIEDQLTRASSTRIRKAHRLTMTLTDIDFKLFLDNYKFERIKLENIVGSRYGYLPDYVQRVIVQLYSSKAAAKIRKAELKAAGSLTLAEERAYNVIKTELARLYGIFTNKPVVSKYAFDPERKEPKIVDKHYISETSKYSPVLYQWGVWTTALVRKEIADLRRKLIGLPEDRRVKVLSGDTDNINYIGSADDIISQYNENVKAQIERRSESLGIQPEQLQGLGQLTVDKYIKYKLTGLKQYCYIRETDSGKVFEYKVGGMSRSCPYFEREFKTPEQRFAHFGLGLVIPREYEPRVVTVPVSEHIEDNWIDRDGNSCHSECDSYLKTIVDKFTIAPLVTSGGIRPDGKLPTLAEVEQLADKIRNPLYNPANYIKKKYFKEV